MVSQEVLLSVRKNAPKIQQKPSKTHALLGFRRVQRPFLLSFDSAFPSVPARAVCINARTLSKHSIFRGLGEKQQRMWRVEMTSADTSLAQALECRAVVILGSEEVVA